MKLPLLSLCLSSALAATAFAQEAPAKPAVDPVVKRTQTIANLKMIGIAMIEFDMEFGAFPNADTAKDVKEATGTKFTFEGDTSNAYFRQLLVTGLKTEKIFQAGQPINPVDDKFATEAQALALGECEFSYLPGATSGSHPNRPLVVMPLIHGEMKFDPKPFAGKAMIMRVDNSVTMLPINEKGEVILDGKSLFDPTQEYWGGKKFEVAWPK